MYNSFMTYINELQLDYMAVILLLTRISWRLFYILNL